MVCNLNQTKHKFGTLVTSVHTENGVELADNAFIL